MHANPPLAKVRGFAAAAALLLFVHPGSAQPTTTPSPTKPETDRKEDEVVVLSPFVVDATEDEGYRATSTLAGSRIKTDLKDVASSITVVTKEFLTDVAAVDVNDVLAYTANAEGSRDFTASRNFLNRPTDDVAANDPGSAPNRIRGLQAADTTRDYFYTIGTWVNFDTYNLDVVTINRGPNSILAGLGSPAGIINYSPQLANLTRNSGQVSYRFGSFSDQRATLNTNYVIKDDMLAVRLAAAWSDRGFQQQPAYNRDKRLYGTLTFQPWEKTTIRASYETVRIEANNPNSLTPEDGVSQWLALGQPSYDSASTDPVSTRLTQDQNAPGVIFDKNGAIEGFFLLNSGYTFFQQNLGNENLWNAQRLNKNNLVQLDEVNLNPSLQNPLRFRALNLSIDQQITRDLYANVAYVRETVDNEFLNLFRSEYATYSVDVNRRLPGGAANPHYGETYMQFRGLDNRQADHNTNEVLRGTATYQLDLTDQNKWLGRYRLTGFIESRETETERWQYNAKVLSDVGYEAMTFRYYLGGSATTPATAVPGHPGLVSGVPRIGGTATVLPSGATSLNTYYNLKSDTRNLVSLDTSAVVLQAYLWDDRIVGMYGVRRDKNEAATVNGTSSGVPNGVNPAPRTYPDPVSVAQTTKTYGVVVHPLKWLSLHYNRSENFIPNAGALDLFGNTTPPPTGVGKDYGFSLNLLEDKLNVKVNWFELTAANASAGPVTDPLARWTVPYMEVSFMPHLVSLYNADPNRGGPTITYQKAIVDEVLKGSGPNGVGYAPLLDGYTSDSVSKGLELELTYNVTRNWRVMASVSKQEAKQTNIAGALTDFIEERLTYWQSLPVWNDPRYRATTNVPGGWGVGRTGLEQWNADNLPTYLRYRSGEGKPSTQLAKWHASLVTNYAFTEGAMRGFNVGAGFRFIDKGVIGNPPITNSAGTVIALDLENPYYRGAYVSVDAWIGYRTKVFEDKYSLSFQLNGRDLEQSGGFRPIIANGNGNHSIYRIVQPRTFYLTTTLEF